MELPICYFCARTKVLCSKDLERLERGEISALDVDISHELVMLKEKKFSQIDKLSFIKAVRIDENVFLLVRNSTEISRKTLIQIAKYLSAKGYGKVRFIEYVSDKRALIEQILFPVRVLGVDVIWLPDGSSEYNIRINGTCSRKMPFARAQAEKIIEQFTGKKTRITFCRR
ncbi:MAG: hypothetical protein DRJ39_00215 [Thermoprotei archaeon]|nr:MAG: hypothetical protein DRZ80_07675 [Thermoprotei archaeon]RLE86122.1 MAG: hypothetical protein DRJ39_00215 [Thermoprotei archaeon]